MAANSRVAPAVRADDIHLKVYYGAMTRTNIEIDDELVERAMRIFRLRSKREAVDFALRKLVDGMSPEEALAMEGTGWGGDLGEIRSREEVPEL